MNPGIIVLVVVMIGFAILAVYYYREKVLR